MQKLNIQDKKGIGTMKNTFCDQIDDGKVFVCIKLKDLSFRFHSSDV